MARIVVVQPPPDLCRFADGVFDRVIGQRVPLTFDGHPSGMCTVVDADVIEGGYAVRLTLDVPDDVVSAHAELPSFTIEENRKGS